ncbi:MAG: hypothetical protein JNL67_15825 [Planctomycetaceae bacterium]|nr:hypothetical protein [Planctomycetaceae bacterium]
MPQNPRGIPLPPFLCPHSFAPILLPCASAASKVYGTATYERRLAEECGQGNEDNKIVYFTWDFHNSPLGDDDFDSASFTHHLLPESRLTKMVKHDRQKIQPRNATFHKIHAAFLCPHSFAPIPLPYASAALEVQGTANCERRLAEECGQGNEDNKIECFTWDFRDSPLGGDDFDSASFTYHPLLASELTKNGKR